jgi:hydroxyacylglutathione hydrolase
MKIQYESAHLVVFESSLYRTTTTLVLGSDYLLLVDPNWLPQEVDFIADYVASNRHKRQAYLLFTHSDYDHIIAYGRFSDFTVIASQAFVDNPKKVDILAEIRGFDDQYYIQRNYAIAYPLVDLPVAADGRAISLGRTGTLRIYQAPGHNTDGILAYSEDQQVLIVGDYLSNAEFPFIYHSIAAYRATLERIGAIVKEDVVHWLISGHGDLAAEQHEMGRRLEEAYRYLDQLAAFVQENQPFPLASWLQGYPWPESLRQAHGKNVELVRKELSSFGR